MVFLGWGFVLWFLFLVVFLVFGVYCGVRVALGIFVVSLGFLAVSFRRGFVVAKRR